MDKPLNQVLKILSEFEILFESAVLDDEEYFEAYSEGAIEVLADCKDCLTDYFLTLIPNQDFRQERLNDFSPLIKARNIYEFQDALKMQDIEIPLLTGFVNTLEDSSLAWEPLFAAIRVYYNLSRIEKISTRSEFLTALAGYSNLEDMNYDFLPRLDAELQALRNCQLARFSEITKIDDLIGQYRPSNHIYRAPVVKFEGSSGGLESELAEWIAKMNLSNTLFDDEDFDLLDENVTESGANLEALKSNWLEKDSRNSTMYDGFSWQVIDANASVDLELGEHSTFVTIHVLSQIRSNGRQNHPDGIIEKDYFKISLLRTGVREEYDSAMDISLLALQILMFQESSNIAFENIEGEIAWIRLKENDYPLVGLDGNSIQETSRLFLDSQ